MPNQYGLAPLASELTSARRTLRNYLDTLQSDSGEFKDISPEQDRTLRAYTENIKSIEQDFTALGGDPMEVGTQNLTVTRNFSLHDTLDANAPVSSGGLAVKAYSSAGNARERVFKSADGAPDEQRAYGFGQWFLAAVRGDLRAIEYCSRKGIALQTLSESGVVRQIDARDSMKALNEATISAGGALVPVEYFADIIVLQEEHGVVRRNCRVWGMTSETARIPKLTTGPNPVYWIPEGAVIGESSLTFEQITLTAKKLGTIVVYTSELAEDSLIDLAEFVASELAWRFSLEEDRVGFLGTGVPADGGILGIIPSLLALDATPGNIASLVIVPAPTGGAGWGAITLDLLTDMVGRLPQFAAARSRGVKWYCSREFFYGCLLNLALKSGGVSESEVIAGQVEPRFLGYPVELTQVMDTAYAATHVPLLFGNLALAVAFGDRRQLSLMGSAHYQYAADLLALRATERFDLKPHSLGNASATQAGRIAGPVIGLYTS